MFFCPQAWETDTKDDDNRSLITIHVQIMLFELMVDLHQNQRSAPLQVEWNPCKAPVPWRTSRRCDASHENRRFLEGRPQREVVQLPAKYLNTKAENRAGP